MDFASKDLGLMCPGLNSALPSKPIDPEEIDVAWNAGFGTLYTEDVNGQALTQPTSGDYENSFSAVTLHTLDVVCARVTLSHASTLF